MEDIAILHLMVPKKKNINLNQPATKGDLKQLREELVLQIGAAEKRTDGKMQQFKEEIISHFDVVAENIHRDVAGANRDEISAIQDKVRQHDTDIIAIKQKVGIS